MLASTPGCTLNPAFDPHLPPESGSQAGESESEGEAPVTVWNLRAVWTTPNQIRWMWDAEGDADRLLRYELVTGSSEAEIAQGEPSVTVWTEAQNPELGRFRLPTGGAVRGTTTTGHVPDQIVYAQLAAVDTAGGRSESNVAAARTTIAPVGEIVIFSEEEMPGYSLPSTFQLASVNPYEGQNHYRHVNTCDGEPVCWQNLRRQDLGMDLSALPAGAYASTAYFEAAVRVTGEWTPWWSTMWLWYVAGCEPCIVRLEGWTLRTDGQYHIIQIPLRVLANENGPAPYEDLVQHGLYGFNIGGQWTDGAIIDVDEVRIRW